MVLNCQRTPFVVIPGEDPGSKVQHSPLQRPNARKGSRVKPGMTKIADPTLQSRLHRSGSIVLLTPVLRAPVGISTIAAAVCRFCHLDAFLGSLFYVARPLLTSLAITCHFHDTENVQHELIQHRATRIVVGPCPAACRA